MRILLFHFSTLLLATGSFFLFGSLDHSRLVKASMTHHPELMFVHDKLLIKDGGSIRWESLIYSAHESRKMRVWPEAGEDGPKQRVADGFQGVNWTWKYHNLVWIALIILSSFLACIFSKWRTQKNS